MGIIRLSHAVVVALWVNKFATMAGRVEVCILMCLRAFLASAHLSLIKCVICGNSVFVSWHSHTYLAFFEEWTSHGLLGTFTRRWSVDHLLRLKQKLIDTRLAKRIDQGDWTKTSSMARSLRVISMDNHLLIVVTCEFWLKLSAP